MVPVLFFYDYVSNPHLFGSVLMRFSQVCSRVNLPAAMIGAAYHVIKNYTSTVHAIIIGLGLCKSGKRKIVS